jgi:hypothetical protein
MSEVSREAPVEATEALEAPESTPGTPEAPEASEAVETPSEAPRANREARYRVERNEARAERDALAERLAEYQTREVHRLAGELAQPSDLFEVGGAKLSDLLTEAGSVDSDAVAEAVSALITARPGLSVTPPAQRAFDKTQATGDVVSQPRPTLAEAFRADRW